MSDTDDRDETHTKASFKPGDRVRVSTRFPVGHCAVPHYVRGKRGVRARSGKRSSLLATSSPPRRRIA
jgi:hypothetical protein